MRVLRNRPLKKSDFFTFLLSFTKLFNGIAYQLKQLLHVQNNITFVAAHLFCKLARTVVSLDSDCIHRYSNASLILGLLDRQLAYVSRN